MENLSSRTKNYLKKEKRKLYKERFNQNHECKLCTCTECGREFYSAGNKLCDACYQTKKRKKAKRKLLDEQYKLAIRLGLIKTIDNK